METLEFLSHRVAFAGLPEKELQQILDCVRVGETWSEACMRSAGRLRRLAADSPPADRQATAQAWQRAACAYHAASFGLHLEPEKYVQLGRILRLRGLARLAHRRALQVDAGMGRQIQIPFEAGAVEGYLRASSRPGAPVIVLLNGLDSICEVEMHAFSSWLLAHGLSALSLDLPSSFSSRPRRPSFAVEKLATPLADWINAQTQFARSRLGAFGVSFGGHLVARLMAGDARFRAGVSVSPPAWIGAHELQLKRVRLMFACAFDLHSESEIEATSGRISIEHVPRAEGRILMLQMQYDQLFGQEHADAFRAWGRDAVEVRRLAAEHVGTSLAHRWLPEVCDWLNRNLS
ncbi:MAG TPA: alpha/beta hydrolase [Pyrinomonadaceae bacterium]|jgi:dienelactone hydrolase